MRFLLYGYIRPAFHPFAFWQEWTAMADSSEEVARLVAPFGDQPGHPKSDRLTGHDMLSLAFSSVGAGASRDIVLPGACEYDPGSLGSSLRTRLREVGWSETPDDE